MPSSRRDPTWPLPTSPDAEAYVELLREIERSPPKVGHALYREACLNDFWFFNRYCLTIGKVICEDPYSEHYGKPWLDHPWLFARCREIQANPDGFLDLWPRFHFKTSLITQSLTLWDLIDSPDLRFGIGTYKSDKTGEGFLAQIKYECEKNELLKGHFPDVFYQNPQQESPLWTNTSLVMKRSLNPHEPTILIFGLMSGLVTSMHFDVLVFDDIVIEKSVSSRDQIEATTEAWRRATGLGADNTRVRMVGTHWGIADTYRYIIDIGAAKLRHHDVYQEDGATPVLRSKEWLAEWRLKMGSYNFAAQMRNLPVSGLVSAFDAQWMRYYDQNPEDQAKRCNVYIFVDTARVTKSADADYTAIAVIGLARGVPYGNFFLLDLVRDRMSLVRMTEMLFDLAERWNPQMVFVEQVAAARDVEHLKDEMHARGAYFRVMEMHEKIRKEERIRRLQPIFEAGRFYLPRHIIRPMDGKVVDLVEVFRAEEYLEWTPEGGSKHDDVLDVLSWVVSPVLGKMLRWPTTSFTAQKDVVDSWRAPRRGRDMRKREVTPWAW